MGDGNSIEDNMIWWSTTTNNNNNMSVLWNDTQLISLYIFISSKLYKKRLKWELVPVIEMFEVDERESDWWDEMRWISARATVM